MKTVGLIGCGAWGKNILRDLLLLKCTVNVVDPDPGSRSQAYQVGASRVLSHVDDLSPDCDGFVVAVPIPQLAKECAGLLKHGKPIFSEKTLCLSMEDFNLLHGLGGSEHLFVMHKWHYHPGIEALRKVAHSERIGKLEELRTIRHAWVKDFHGGDVFWTLAVHDLSILKHILGYIPSPVKTITVIKNNEELPISFTTAMGRNPTVTMSISGRHPEAQAKVSIRGSSGYAELTDAYADHINIRNEENEEKVPIDTTFPLYLELKEFVEYLHDGPRPQCDLQSAKEVTQAILRLEEADRLLNTKVNKYFEP
ncbi:MAG: Gfo/Idh/MocA family oxidoreductase [Candidatus Neomarinimicrobiota bacterium]